MTWDSMQSVLGILLIVAFVLLMMRGCCGMAGCCGRGKRSDDERDRHDSNRRKTADTNEAQKST